jgi:hypothetical protein
MQFCGSAVLHYIRVAESSAGNQYPQNPYNQDVYGIFFAALRLCENINLPDQRICEKKAPIQA